MAYEFRLSQSEDFDESYAFECGKVGPVDPACEELKRRTAAALIATNAKLTIFDIEYKKIAEFQKITIEEARRRYRYVELNGPAKESGIQITLFDHSAVVRIPLWHGGAAAGPVFEDALECMRVICQETGYRVFDDQIEKEVKLAEGIDESITCYQECCAGKWPSWPVSFHSQSVGGDQASLKSLFESKKRKK